MIIYILFAQRREAYPGQYAPEALATMNEFDYEENGQWLHTKLEECEKSDEYVALKILGVDVGSQDKLRELLVGAPTIEGTIIEPPMMGRAEEKKKGSMI
jgi:hypothetical protein